MIRWRTFTRRNSRRLSAAGTAFTACAWAAIQRSLAPIEGPWRARTAQICPRARAKAPEVQFAPEVFDQMEGAIPPRTSRAEVSNQSTWGKFKISPISLEQQYAQQALAIHCCNSALTVDASALDATPQLATEGECH